MTSVRDGIRWLLANRPVLALTAFVGSWSFFGWIPEAVLVLYVKEDLHGTSVVFGAILSATAAGAALGGLIAGRIVARVGAGRLLVPGLVVYGLCLIPPVFTSSAIVVGAVFFVQGLPVLILSVASVTIRQAAVPNAMLGRITSVFYLVGAGLSPLGLLLGGVIGQYTGLRSTFVVGGAGVVAAALLLARPLSHLSQPGPGEDLVAADPARSGG